MASSTRQRPLLAHALDAGAAQQRVEHVAQRQQPHDVHQLEGAVRVVERLAEQDLPRALVVAAQGVRQRGDRHHAHADAEGGAQPALQLGIDVVGFRRRALPEPLSRLLQLAEVVAVAAEEVVDRRLRTRRHWPAAVAPASAISWSVIDW